MALVEELGLAEGVKGNTVEELHSQRRTLEQQSQDMKDQELVVEETVENKRTPRIYLGRLGLDIQGRILENYRNHCTRLNDREMADEGRTSAAEELAD